MRVKWAEILERLKRARNLDENTVLTERRASRRVTRVMDLVAIRDDGRRVELIATNFGVGGLRAESSARLRRDEQLWVQRRREDLPEGRKPHRARVHVVWSRRRRDYPVFHVGMQFVADTEEKRLSAAVFLLEDCDVCIQGSGQNETRGTVRVPAQYMPVSFTTADGVIGEGRLEDLSLSGASLESHRHVPPGEAIHLRITLPDDVLPLACSGEVVRAPWKNSVQRFQLGIRFTEVSPTHGERLATLLASLIRQRET